jgi:transposase
MLMKKRSTLSLDLRERILASYDEGESTREEVAKRFRVSLGMVKKLIQQRRHSGDIAAQHHRAGRKPVILESHCEQMSKLPAKTPDMTLEELRIAVELDCTVQAIHIVLGKMGLTFKKRHFAPASKTGPTSPKPAINGKNSKVNLTRRGSYSSTKAEPKRT